MKYMGGRKVARRRYDLKERARLRALAQINPYNPEVLAKKASQKKQGAQDTIPSIRTDMSSSKEIGEKTIQKNA